MTPNYKDKGFEGAILERPVPQTTKKVIKASKIIFFNNPANQDISTP
jgi:hypothetical protein